MKYYSTILGILWCLGLSNQITAQTFTLDSTTLVADTVITGLNVPWELKWGPDNYLWVTEREGKVSRINPTTGNRTVILDISQANGGPVYQLLESGMLGFAFHPQFPDSSYIYLVYTYLNNGNIRERMVKYTYLADSLVNPQTLIEDIQGNSTHNGSRLIIGPDNKLYMTTGDAQTQSNAQNTASLNGKVLRFNLDGSIPTDNPIAGSPVWTWGHRNAQGLAFGPTGIFYSSEHGPNNDDEINIIQRGRNYGWPTVMGTCDQPSETAFCADSNVMESIFNWTPTIAPGDLIYYNHPSIPEWQGSLLLSVMKNKRVIRLTLNGAGNAITSETSYFFNQWGRLRDICAGPDGTIYLATNGANSNNTDPNTHSIIRLRNPNYQSALTIDAGPDKSICDGGSVQISPTVYNAASPYSYSWAPATGLSCTTCSAPIASPTATTQYIVTVTDNNNDTATDTITVNVSSQPGPITYTAAILDTFGNPAMIEININAPAADSVVVISNYYDTIGIFLNTQNIIFIDSSGGVSCTIGDGDCWIEFQLWVYAYSACGIDSLYDSQQIVVQEWNGIHKLTYSFFKLFPNPTNEQINISGLKADDSITVLSIAGRQMMQFTTSNTYENILNINSLPSGIYFIQVERDGHIGVQKLIKY